MGAHGHQAVLIEQKDAVRPLDRCKTVGYDEEGLAAGHRRQGIEDRALQDAVQGGGRFIHDQDVGVLEQGAGNGQALFLAFGQIEPPFIHPGGIALRQALDEIIDPGSPADAFYVLHAGLLIAIAQVIGNTAGEQQVALRDITDAAAQAGQVIACGRLPVKEHLSLLGMVEGHDQRKQGGLANPAGTDNRHMLARLDIE